MSNIATFTTEELEQLVRIEKKLAEKAAHDHLIFIGTPREQEMELRASTYRERYYEAYEAWSNSKIA